VGNSVGGDVGALDRFMVGCSLGKVEIDGCLIGEADGCLIGKVVGGQGVGAVVGLWVGS